MTAFLSSSLYVTESITSIDVNSPIVCWHSVFRRQDITVAPEEIANVTGSAYNIWNPETYSMYASQVVSDEQTMYIKLHNYTNQYLNYVTIVGHNLYQLGASHKLQSSTDDATWVDVITEQEPIGQGPILYLFNDNNSEFFRIVVKVTTGTDYQFKVAHVRGGQGTRLLTSRLVGVTPPNLNRTTQKQGLTSTTGKYLGAWVESVGYSYDIDQVYYTRQYVDDKVLPFLLHCDLLRTEDSLGEGPLGTFVYAWRPQSDPTGVVYCLPPQNIENPTVMNPIGLMKWKISGQCEAWEDLL